MDNSQEQMPQIEERISNAWHEIVTMENRLKDLSEQTGLFTQTLQSLEQTISSSKDQILAINNHYADYYAKTDSSIKSKFEVVIEHHQAIDQFQKVSIEIKKDLEDFKEFIYGNETTNKTGFKKEIEVFLEKSKSTTEAFYKNWSESYQTLFSKIEGLLPGATATGLSKAYQDQKISYKTPVILWSLVFSITVATMMGFGIVVYNDTKLNDITSTLQHIVARLPFFIPAVWLAVFASKQQSQYKRLQQEYIYKETLAKSYEAYKREIDLLTDGEEKNELHQKLITSMVEMCGYNPSLTLENKSHDDKPPIPGDGIFKGVLRNNKTKGSEA